MPPHPPPRPRRGTDALFVRIPSDQAEALHRASFELKLPKQELISALLARYVDPDSPNSLAELGEMGGKRRVIVEAEDSALAVGQASFRAHEPEVLTLEEAGELLSVEPELVAELAESGELPGRKLGGSWRFARSAVLTWLAGS